MTHWSMNIFVLAMLTLLQAQIHDILYPVLLALVGYVFVVCMTPLDHSAHVTIGWGLGKKRLPIDCGILVENADIYRRLLGQKNPGPYFIKLRSRGIVVLWYYKHYNGSFSQLQMGISENFP